MNNQNLYHGNPQDITDDSSVPAEPVTLQEMKDYLRLEGFVDTDESTTESLSDFAFDDTLITNMIIAARRKAEDFCGISIVYHRWKDIVSNGAGDIEIRMGPVRGFVGMFQKDGTAIAADAYDVLGFNFMEIETVFCDKRIIIYDAGYEDVPKMICLAIKQMVAFMYDNRGNSSEQKFASVNTDMPQLAMSNLKPFKRTWTWLS